MNKWKELLFSHARTDRIFPQEDMVSPFVKRIEGFNPVLPSSAQSGSNPPQPAAAFSPPNLPESADKAKNSSAITLTSTLTSTAAAALKNNKLPRVATPILKPTAVKPVFKLPNMQINTNATGDGPSTRENPESAISPISLTQLSSEITPSQATAASAKEASAKTSVSNGLPDTLPVGISQIKICRIDSVTVSILQTCLPAKFNLSKVGISIVKQGSTNPNKIPFPPLFHPTLSQDMFTGSVNNRGYLTHAQFLANNGINNLTSFLNFSSCSYSVAARASLGEYYDEPLDETLKRKKTFRTFGKKSIDELFSGKEKEKRLVPSNTHITEIELNAHIPSENTFLPIYLLKAGRYCLIAAYSGEGNRLGVQLRRARNEDRYIPIFRYFPPGPKSSHPKWKAWDTARSVYVYIQELLPLADVHVPADDPFSEKLKSPNYTKSLTIIDGSEVFLKINPVLIN